jgi:hypothetical protein
MAGEFQPPLAQQALIEVRVGRVIFQDEDAQALGFSPGT